MPQKPPKVRYHEVAASEAGQRIDNLLLGQLKGVPRSHVYRLLSSGQVRRNGGRVKPGARLEAGDHIRIPPVRVAPPRDQPPPDDLVARVEAAIIAESDDFVVLDKPAGVAVHSGSSVAFGLIECLRQVRGDAVDLVHRLDRDTSGVLVCARSPAALSAARDALGTDGTDKRYQAIVHGHWRLGQHTVDQALDTKARRGGERTVVVDDSGKQAVTHFAAVTTGTLVSTVSAVLGTGRTHQIRVHAAELGHPVVGDRRYGDRQLDRSVGSTRLFLHAASIRLVDAQGHELLAADAPIPDAFETLQQAGG